MLILTRKIGQSIFIGDDIKISVQEFKGNQVRIGVDAPSHIKIFREEIYKQIKEQNERASLASEQAETLLPEIANPTLEEVSSSAASIHLEDGLVGLPKEKEFYLVEAEDEFYWFQSKNENIRLLVLHLDPSHFGMEALIATSPDYKKGDELGVFVIVSIEKDVSKTSVNALAPIVINFRTQCAHQHIVESEEDVPAALTMPIDQAMTLVLPS